MSVVVEYPEARPGLASMLGDLIRQNLHAHPDRERLLRSSATCGIEVTDAGVSVSVGLAPGRVTVSEGLPGRPDVLIRTDAETLMALSAVPLRLGLPDPASPEGRRVAGHLLGGRLRVRGLVRHPVKVTRLTRLLAVA